MTDKGTFKGLEAFSDARALSQLRALARRAGVQPSYTNTEGATTWAKPATLIAVMEALWEIPLGGPEDLERLSESLLPTEVAGARLQPVYVLWDGQPSVRALDLFAVIGHQPFEITLEDGSRLKPKFDSATCTFKPSLPWGYHQLRVRSAGRELCSTLICAPRRLDVPQAARKSWGLFAPLYGLRSRADEGLGSLREMKQVCRSVARDGGSFVGTLPLLATACDDQGHCDPSPYSALTRLFWNEFYLDLDESLRHWGAPAPRGLAAQIRTLRATRLVDYNGISVLKRKVIGQVAEHFFARGHHESASFADFLREKPRAQHYAEFRGGKEKPQEVRYHLFAQFEMERQLGQISDAARHDGGAGLYLDFPVGVSKGGFDAQAFERSFVRKLSAGAPPDSFFSHGQNWGFSPMHPERMRQTGYDYLIESFRNHLRHATILRLDHVMGLYRIYSVPDGWDAKDGAYLRFRAEELFAVACLEAQRFGVDIVGEDLGTVPPPVRELMTEHNFKRLWVVEFEFPNKPAAAFQALPPNALLSVNTHDMSPFRGFVEGRDLELLEELKLASPEKRAEIETGRAQSLREWGTYLVPEAKEGQATARQMYLRLMKKMAASHAPYLLVNAEDLWGERESQNMPGTWQEYPNWRRKLRHPIEGWRSLSTYREIVKLMQRYRRRRKSPHKRIAEVPAP